MKITPWEYPDGDGFGVYKAHMECNELWQEVGRDVEWEFPDPSEYRGMLEERRDEKRLKEAKESVTGMA